MSDRKVSVLPFVIGSFRWLASSISVTMISPGGDQTWPADRRLANLGTLRIEAIASDNAAASKSLVFFPGNLPEGIEPSGDPLIASRDAAYAESLTRRNQ